MRARGSAVLCLLLLATPVCSVACNSILGADDYRFSDATATGSSSTGVASSSSSTGAGGTGGTGAGGMGGASCEGPMGCYACEPTTNEQFFDHCTDATCVPFDNTNRLTNLLPDGGLPPVPPGHL